MISGRKLLAGDKETEGEVNHKLPWNPRKKSTLATGKKFVYRNYATYSTSLISCNLLCIHNQILLITSAPPDHLMEIQEVPRELDWKFADNYPPPNEARRHYASLSKVCCTYSDNP